MIVLDDGSRKKEIYDMWQRNFHDPAAYAMFYFDEVYGKNEILLNLEDKDGEETLKGMIHLNPYVLSVKGRPVKADYIVGVATDEEFRRQGVMRELLVEGFAKMRSQGKIFTYLMPADENYYLPFDFRFGMSQTEQELEFLPKGEKEDRKYSFSTEETEEELKYCACMENNVKSTMFDIFTEISLPYLHRLTKETGSEFGQIIYVRKDGEYIGRFVADAENDYLILSQIFCADRSLREEFLREILFFCEKNYHYSRYQLILDPSWEDVVKKPGPDGDIRWMPAKKVKIIMYRILNLERLGEFLTSDLDGDTDIFVEDGFLKEQEGCYHFSLKEGHVSVTKTEDNNPEGGRIAIGDLTQMIFSCTQEGLPETDRLTEKGKEILSGILPLSKSCIMEIV
ncbi:MAG: GNAT family N-acetyltransferase [Eubacterium sp.]|nr:GNAT family N-acetyltransferase [Eubacterium sp.]MDY5498051.1 GNAT family N-acetyltransferase [Anaerobutyricum sp.]